MSKARWEAAFWITMGAMLASAFEMKYHWWMGIPMILSLGGLGLCLKRL